MDKQDQIPQGSKAGFPHFMGKESWYDTGQIWRVSNQGIIDSANKEQSNRREGTTLNQVASSFIDKILPGAVDH